MQLVIHFIHEYTQTSTNSSDLVSPDSVPLCSTARVNAHSQYVGYRITACRYNKYDSCETSLTQLPILRFCSALQLIHTLFFFFFFSRTTNRRTKSNEYRKNAVRLGCRETAIRTRKRTRCERGEIETVVLQLSENR